MSHPQSELNLPLIKSNLTLVLFHMFILPSTSCVLPGVLEAEECIPGPPLGLPGLPGGGGAPPAGVRSQGTMPGEKPHHGCQGAILPQVYQDQENHGRSGTYLHHGELLLTSS